MTSRTTSAMKFGAGVFALTVVTACFWLGLWVSVVPVVAGWSPVAVTSGSMTPAVSVGDVVLTNPFDAAETLDPGAIIVFENPAGGGLVTHRVMSIDASGAYITKGDANRANDSTPIRPDSIRGVGHMLVPGAGFPLVWAARGQWGSLAIAVLLFAAALWASRWAISSRHDPWGPQPGSKATRAGEQRSRRSPRRSVVVAGMVTAALASTVVAPTMEATATFADPTSTGGNSFVVAQWKYIADLDTGTDHTCVARIGYGVWCSGHNNKGQLGDNTTTDRQVPVEVKGPGGIGVFGGGVVDVATGDDDTCAVKVDGTVWCWGLNSAGQLGDNSTTDRRVPVQVLGAAGVGFLGGVRGVTAGARHTCAVKTDNTVWCWGHNNKGQLGDNTTTDRRTPVQVTDTAGTGVLGNVASVSAGLDFTCALKGDSSVWCWGQNPKGQVGDNTTSDRSTPVLVLGPGGVGVFTGATEIAVGDSSVCSVKTDGTIWCWGHNNQGQIGDNTTTDRRTPVQVLGAGGVGFLTSAVTADVGLEHACAVKSDTSVWCWGRNQKGQLGDNTTTDRRTPDLVKGPNGVGILTLAFLVRTGEDITCAARSDGMVNCWGHNNKGQLGDNSTTDRSTPVQFAS